MIPLLLQATLLEVDIVDASSETLTWQGVGNVFVTDPDGTSLGAFPPGMAVPLTVDGTYTVVLTADQPPGWQLEVGDPVVSGGRVSSTDWRLEDNTAIDLDLWALVDDDVSVQVELEGVVGHRFGIGARHASLDADVPLSSGLAPLVGTVPLYLEAPSLGGGSAVTPTLTGVAFGSGSLDCPVASSAEPGILSFDVDAPGRFHLICDDTVVLEGPTTAGANEVSWDGADLDGALACTVRVVTGELHLVADDVETVFDGITLGGLPLYWDDSLLSTEANAIGMAASSGRTWGDGGFSGRGDRTRLDTITWLAEDTGSVAIDVVDATEDADGDGLSDREERCEHGTDPTTGDTDADGLSDADELAVGTDPHSDDSDGDGRTDGEEGAVDTDGDGLIDALDDDDDDDGLPTMDEMGDTDADGIIDALDPDDDGDGIPTRTEGLDDLDGDTIPNAYDLDSDGDGRPDADERWTDLDSDGINDAYDPYEEPEPVDVPDPEPEPEPDPNADFVNGSYGGGCSTVSADPGALLLLLLPLLGRRR